ncbi:unnamed protein product [Tilletia controversa]|nr:unnamed protein product [Tilletia controversa]
MAAAAAAAGAGGGGGGSAGGSTLPGDSFNSSSRGDVGDEDDLLPPFLVGGQPFLDTTPLRDLSRRTFFHALAAATPPIPPPAAAASSSTSTPRPPTDITPKTVILDPALAGPLGLTIDVASLKAHGVDKMFWLELDDNPTEHDELDDPAPPPSSAPGPSSSSLPQQQQQQQHQPADVLGIRARWPPKRLRVPVNAPTRSVVYICRPEIACMRVIAGHIIADLAANSQVPINPSGPLPPSSSLSHTYSLLLSPRRTELSLLYLSSLRLLPAPTPVDASSSNPAAASSSASSTTTPSSYLTTVLDLPLEFLPLDGSPAPAPPAPQSSGVAKGGPSSSSTIPPAITSSSLLSLEWTHHFAFTRLYRDGDHACIYLAAQALMTVQHVYGLIPRILGKGDLAKRLADLLIRQRREHLSADPTNPALVAPPTFMPMAPAPPASTQAGGAASAGAPGSATTASAGWSNPNRIDALIIIDRSVDWASVLCTQLTYEGLIKEVVGIRNAHIDVDASLVGSGNTPGPAGTPSSSSAVLESRSPGGPRKPNAATSTPSTGAKRKYLLSSNTDPLYTRLRDLNFSAVGERLHLMATRLNASYADRHSAKTMAQIKAFVGKLGSLQAMHQALGVHTDLTERITRRTSADEVFHRLLEIQQNIVAGLDTPGQLGAIEDLIYASTGGPGGLLSGLSVRDARPSGAGAEGSAAGGGAGTGSGQPSTASLLPILRLLCLMSVVNGGLKAKNLEYVKRELCQTFGYEVLPLLLQLSKVGLLTKEGAGPGAGFSSTASGMEGSGGTGPGQLGASTNMAAGNSQGGGGSGAGGANLPTSLSATGSTSYSGFSAVRRTLKLINDDVDERNPRDISYVFSGYAPLSVRLVQIVAQREAAHPIAGWKGYEDVLSILPGATFDEVQRPVQNFRPAAAAAGATTSSIPAANKRSTTSTASTGTPLVLQPQLIDPDSPRTTLVFFLGGATYAEVSALRFMSAQTRNRRFIAMTTHMVSGDEILGGL